MKIAVLCLPGIGDALMATPMIRLLKKTYPHATVDVVCMFSSVACVFKNNPYIHKVYEVSLYKQSTIPGFRFGHYNFQGVAKLFDLRRHKYDVSILSFPSFSKEYHIVSWIIGAKKRIAHTFKSSYWKELNFLETHSVPVDENAHNVVNNINLLTSFGLNVHEMSRKKLSYDLPLAKEDIAFGKKYMKQHGLDKSTVVAIHPGSIDSKAGMLKRWPRKRYTSLINALTKLHKKIVIFVGPFELSLGKELEKYADTKNCTLVEQITFGQSIGILSNCRLLIANDNGFSHIANALKVPEIVLFGPTNPLWCAPYNQAKTVVIRSASFTPWFRNDTKVTNPPKNAKSGMEEISVQDVLHHAKAFL